MYHTSTADNAAKILIWMSIAISGQVFVRPFNIFLQPDTADR